MVRGHLKLGAVGLLHTHAAPLRVVDTGLELAGGVVRARFAHCFAQVSVPTSME